MESCRVTRRSLVRTGLILVGANIPWLAACAGTPAQPSPAPTAPPTAGSALPTAAPAPPTQNPAPTSSPLPTAAPAPPTQAPAPTSSPNSPEGVVRRAYEALGKNDLATMFDLMDPKAVYSIANPNEYRTLKVPWTLLQGLKGLNTNINQLTFKDLSFSLVRSEGDWAQVQVKGYAQIPASPGGIPINGIELVVRLSGDFYLKSNSPPTRYSGTWLLSSALVAATNALQDPGLELALLDIAKTDPIQGSKPREGWTTYTARFSVTNKSDRYVPLHVQSVSQASVSVLNGPSYPVVVNFYRDRTSINHDARPYLILKATMPPGVRVTHEVRGRGTVDFFDANYEIPSTLPAQSINLAERGTFAVSALDAAKGAFPRGEPVGTKVLPATIDLPDLASVTIDRSSKQGATPLEFEIKITSKVATADISIPLQLTIILDSGAWTPAACYINGSPIEGFQNYTVGPLQSKTFSGIPAYIVDEEQFKPKRWLVLDGQIVGTFRY